MRLLAIGTVLAILAVGSPAAAAPGDAPDLEVSAKLTLYTGRAKPAAGVGEGAWVTLTITNAGKATAEDVTIVDGEDDGFRWSSPPLGDKLPFDLKPGESQDFTRYGSIENDADQAGVAYADYAVKAANEPEGGTAKVSTKVVFATGDASITAYSSDPNRKAPPVTAAFTYTVDGVEKVWRTVRTCASGRIQVAAPGGHYVVRFTAPEGWKMRQGYEEFDVSVMPWSFLGMDARMEPTGPAPSESATAPEEPECTVSPSPSTSASPTPTPTATATTPAPGAGGGLPVTGTNIVLVVGLGVLLLLAGGLTVVFTRRK